MRKGFLGLDVSMIFSANGVLDKLDAAGFDECVT